MAQRFVAGQRLRLVRAFGSSLAGWLRVCYSFRHNRPAPAMLAICGSACVVAAAPPRVPAVVAATVALVVVAAVAVAAVVVVQV